jgi:hypothetical protein
LGEPGIPVRGGEVQEIDATPLLQDQPYFTTLLALRELARELRTSGESGEERGGQANEIAARARREGISTIANEDVL